VRFEALLERVEGVPEEDGCDYVLDERQEDEKGEERRDGY
jgi:hypothetical protein